MKGVLMAANATILAVNARQNDDSSIAWTEAIALMGTETNTLTVDKGAVSKLKVGATVNLVISATEEARAYRNGGGAYISTKFRVVDVLPANNSTAGTKV